MSQSGQGKRRRGPCRLHALKVGGQLSSNAAHFFPEFPARATWPARGQGRTAGVLAT